MIRSDIRVIRYHSDNDALIKVELQLHGKSQYLTQLTHSILANRVKSFNVRISNDVYTCHLNQHDKRDLISTGNLLQVLYQKCDLAKSKFCNYCTILDKSDILNNKSYRLILN